MIHGLEEELQQARDLRDGKVPMPTDEDDLGLFARPGEAEAAAPAAAPAPFVCGECRTEVSTRKLTCARCKRAHYCGKTCQRRAWVGGHRRVCRSATAFAAGQRCILKGLDARPDLNGKVVVVEGPSSAGGGERWRVRVAGTREVVAVRPGVLMDFWSPGERPDPRPPRLEPAEALGRLAAYMDTLPARDDDRDGGGEQA